MNNLGAAATATLGIASIPFIAAWDAAGQAGRKYRQEVKMFLYFGLALVTIPAGIACAIVARIGARLDPRPLSGGQGMKCYLFRRRYEGAHYVGVSVRSIAARLAREQADALAS